MSKRKPIYPLTIHEKRHHSSSPQPHPRRALLIVDVQNDFCPPNGSLAVPEGHHIVPIINQLRITQHWDLICLSQDWHPQGHISFYDTHQHKPEAHLFSPITLEDGTEQILWPIHCVQDSDGAMFHPDLKIDNNDHIIQKGTHIDVDSYSAFFDNLRRYRTHLSDLLHSHDIQHVYVCGLALDYCVGYTACDSQSEGFITSVIQDATRGVAAASSAAMLDRFRELGINIIQSTDIPNITSTSPSASSFMATTSQDDVWMASSSSSPAILSASSSSSSHFLSPSLSPVSSTTSSPCLSPSPLRYSLGDPETVSDSEGWCSSSSSSSSSSSPEISQQRIIHTSITSLKLPNAVTTRSVTRSHI